MSRLFVALCVGVCVMSFSAAATNTNNDLSAHQVRLHLQQHSSLHAQSSAARLAEFNLIERFTSFMLQFNKTYALEQLTARFESFKNTLALVTAHNAQPGVAYKLGLHFFADWSAEERARLKGNNPGTAPAPAPATSAPLNATASAAAKAVALQGLPSAIDWRDVGAVTSPKSQGGCGSCWDFAAVACMESAQFIDQGILESFSEQYVLDCSKAGTCANGGWSYSVFNYVDQAHGNNGVVLSSDYRKYSQSEGTCSVPSSAVKRFPFNNGAVPRADEAALLAMVAQRPVQVSIWTNPQFDGYSGGVFTDPACATANKNGHAVVVVGYGTDPSTGLDYWLVKNSWGGSWGESGFIRMQRGVNICSLTTYDQPHYVTFAPPANLALGQPAAQSSTYQAGADVPLGASLAVDGSQFTFQHCNCVKGDWWYVDLGTAFQLNRIHLSNRAGGVADRINGVTLHLQSTLDTNPPASSALFTFDGAQSSYRVAAQNQVARFVLLRMNKATCLHVQEMLVFGTNFAVGAAATQSSSYSTDTGASLAVDGNPFTVSHSACAANDWWYVDLQSGLSVGLIRVLNRQDGEQMQARLVGAKLFVQSTLNLAAPASSAVYTFTTAQPSYSIRLNGVAARFILIKQPAASCLHIGEVEVYGQPGTCDVVADGTPMTMSCPSGFQITGFSFAAFGTVSGSCGAFVKGSCEASSSSVLSVLNSACLGRNSCSLMADYNTFGDPCSGTRKWFAVQVQCGAAANACATNNGGCGSAPGTVCTPALNGGATCSCADYYMGTPPSVACKPVVNECATSNGGCGPVSGAVCAASPSTGKAQCSCLTGYTLLASGKCAVAPGWTLALPVSASTWSFAANSASAGVWADSGFSFVRSGNPYSSSTALIQPALPASLAGLKLVALNISARVLHGYKGAVPSVLPSLSISLLGSSSAATGSALLTWSPTVLAWYDDCHTLACYKTQSKSQALSLTVPAATATTNFLRIAFAQPQGLNLNLVDVTLTFSFK